VNNTNDPFLKSGISEKVIKMSDSVPGTSTETIGDIQNYLADFNPKDSVISKSEPVLDGDQEDDPTETGLTLGSADASGSGQYFVDQETGQYYFQSSNGETLTVVDADGPVTTGMLEGDDGSHEMDQDTDLAQVMVQHSDLITKGEPDLPHNQVVLTGAGSDQYQTVTIVPNDSNSGEVSYVLIMQQNETQEKKAAGVEVGEDMAVYDFETENDPDYEDEDLSLDDKAKVMKMLPPKRPSQIAGGQAHMCNYCNYTTPKRYLLSRHMKSHSEERPHKCSVCERGFKTLASLQNHVNTHTGTKPHKCKYCEASFTTSGELVRHVRYRHTHEKPHKCPDCDYMSVELSKLKRHMRCHSGERPYQCPHCTYASPDTFKLKRHLRIHTGEKPYECDICHARFTQSNSLKAHRTIHTGDKPVYQCELCPTTCGRKTDLRLHVQKLHTSERPMHCKMCGKSFPDRYTLKVHKKTHEGEKCFKCDLCPYSSISQRHLESHMLIHTDQKPFQCDQCDQSFRQKQLLKRHQNLYHNPAYVPPAPKEKTHECPECGRSFRHKGNLIRHMALHDPESTAQEKAMALKIGRQKKIQIIDGQRVEVFTGEDSEEEEDPDMDGIPMQGEDGQHYVVLEVIQLPDDGNGAGHGVVQIAGGGEDYGHQMATQGITILPSILEEGEMADMQHLGEDMQHQQQPVSQEEIRIKKEQERANCFGFGDDSDSD